MDESSEAPGGGFAVEKSNAGVAMAPVAAGGKSPEGVEACSVANRSGAGEAATGLLHPTKNVKSRMDKKNLVTIQFH